MFGSERLAAHRSAARGRVPGLVGRVGHLGGENVKGWVCVLVRLVPKNLAQSVVLGGCATVVIAEGPPAFGT